MCIFASSRCLSLWTCCNAGLVVRASLQAVSGESLLTHLAPKFCRHFCKSDSHRICRNVRSEQQTTTDCPRCAFPQSISASQTECAIRPSHQPLSPASRFRVTVSAKW